MTFANVNLCGWKKALRQPEARRCTAVPKKNPPNQAGREVHALRHGGGAVAVAAVSRLAFSAPTGLEIRGRGGCQFAAMLEMARHGGRILVRRFDQRIDFRIDEGCQMFGGHPYRKYRVGDQFTEVTALLDAGVVDLGFNCAEVVHTVLHCVDAGGTGSRKRMACMPGATPTTHSLVTELLRRTNRRWAQCPSLSNRMFRWMPSIFLMRYLLRLQYSNLDRVKRRLRVACHRAIFIEH